MQNDVLYVHEMKIREIKKLKWKESKNAEQIIH